MSIKLFTSYLFRENDDPYFILDFDFTTSKKEVATKYKLLARIYHPDKFDEKILFTSEDVVEIFKSISNAYESLIYSKKIL